MLPHNCKKYKYEEKKMTCRHSLELKSYEYTIIISIKNSVKHMLAFCDLSFARKPVFGNGNNNGADQSSLFKNIQRKKKESLTTTDFS